MSYIQWDKQHTMASIKRKSEDLSDDEHSDAGAGLSDDSRTLSSFSSSRGATDHNSTKMKRIIDILKKIDKNQVFWDNPDLDKFSLYRTYVKKSMSFNTILENITSGLYVGNVEKFKMDVELIWQNSERFNGIEHEVTKFAYSLREKFNFEYEKYFNKSDSSPKRQKTYPTDTEMRQQQKLIASMKNQMERMEKEIDTFIGGVRNSINSNTVTINENISVLNSKLEESQKKIHEQSLEINKLKDITKSLMGKNFTVVIKNILRNKQIESDITEMLRTELIKYLNTSSDDSEYNGSVCGYGSASASAYGSASGSASASASASTAAPACTAESSPVSLAPQPQPQPQPLPLPHTLPELKRTQWQSEEDLPSRRKMITQIISLLQRRTPNASREWSANLPDLARRLEDSLYRMTPSREEYNNFQTLKHRLQQHAMSMGARAMLKPSAQNSQAQHAQAPQQQQMQQRQMQQQPQMMAQLADAAHAQQAPNMQSQQRRREQDHQPQHQPQQQHMDQPVLVNVSSASSIGKRSPRLMEICEGIIDKLVKAKSTELDNKIIEEMKLIINQHVHSTLKYNTIYIRSYINNTITKIVDKKLNQSVINSILKKIDEKITNIVPKFVKDQISSPVTLELIKKTTTTSTSSYVLERHSSTIDDAVRKQLTEQLLTDLKHDIARKMGELIKSTIAAGMEKAL